MQQSGQKHKQMLTIDQYIKKLKWTNNVKLISLTIYFN